MFVYYYIYVPKLVPNFVSIFGIKFSDKSAIYLVGLQLLFNVGMRSALLGISGLLLGILYHSDICRTSSWRVPSLVRRFFSRYVTLMYLNNITHTFFIA